MSDPKYGDPVDEPQPVDDVVGSARAGLADAEAASREAAARDAVSAEDWDKAYSSGSDLHPTPTATAATAPADHPDRPFRSDADYSREEVEAVDHDIERSSAPVGERASAADHPDAATHAYDGYAAGSYTGVAPSEPVKNPEPAAEPAYETTTPAAAPQPIFVQAPEAPQPRGNRGAAGAIGLLAALVFAVIYLGAALGFGALGGEVTAQNIGTRALDAVTSFWLWVPVVTFFLAFWVLGAILNRGRWGHWVIFGLLVGIASYGGHLLGQLFQAPFWNIAPSQAATLVREEWLAPLAIVALVAGRELTIWFGAWVSARGKRVTELNAEAQREYERTLEAGPQLHRY